ncbi:hypothetical protein ACIPV2_00480 [Microbacterium sp. NPDC089987]|uniref:hypothetical protein n=1 Tax=Microbacterium sp. NPDC089987 TaxID=3364202 RepID=UPI00381E859C
MALNAAVDPGTQRDISRYQLAAGLLPYGGSNDLPPIEIVSLQEDDPWRLIYQACLGSLPEHIDPEIVRHGNWVPDVKFEDFVEVQRVHTTGSLDDLLTRTWPRTPVITPRRLSMTSLSYASTASSHIRSAQPILPASRFSLYDAGPNVVVVCSPGSLDDLALLWNLRAAHGDFYATPIGLPLSALSPASLSNLATAGGLARHGLSASSLYVTSCSVPTEELVAAAANISDVSVATPEDLLMFGTVLGWSRDEVLVWENGHASYKALDMSRHSEVFEKRNINDLLILHFDARVEDAPLPVSDDYRVEGFHDGAYSHWSSPRFADKITRLQWPSRELMAHSLASIRDLEVRESAPGIAARLLITMMGGLWEAYMLCHAPLLSLLESMSARQGFNWYKERLRGAGIVVQPGEAVGASIDELPEKSFHDFKRVLGNNDKAAKYWLEWAERASIIIKGFPLQCGTCGAKQWIPIGSFAPPITCRGCATAIDLPFGDRPTIDFKYRLSEPARRVYEADAMGHILTARFLESILGSDSNGRLIGSHPGMSIFPFGETRELGEADVLLLTRAGEFIPVEVKRMATGLTSAELAKLDTLAGALQSPWSATVACQYAQETGNDLDGIAARYDDGTHRRMVLTYDAVLEPHAMWSMGADPFDVPALSAEQIGEREREFVDSIARRATDTPHDWLTYSMLRRRDRDT